MSGPKVVKIVTKQEMEAICRGQIAAYQKAVEAFKKYAKKHDCLTSDLADELKLRLEKFSNVDINQYEKLERDVSLQIDFLDSERRCIESQVVARKLNKQKKIQTLGYIKQQLINSCKESHIELPDILKKGSNLLLYSDDEVENLSEQLNELFHQLNMPSLTKETSLTDIQKELVEQLKDNSQTQTVSQWYSQQLSTEQVQKSPKTVRLMKVIAELDALECNDNIVSDFISRANEMMFQEKESLFDLKLDSLVIEIADFVKAKKQLEEKVRLLNGLFEEIKAFDLLQFEDAFAQLRQESSQANFDNIDSLLEKVNQLKSDVIENFSDIHRRKVLLAGLADLGYEISENLETAWVEGGKLVLKRPGNATYGIELIGPKGLDKFQTRIVSNQDSSSRTKQQDKEEEESWCEGFSALKEHLLDVGSEIVVEKAISPGVSPIKETEFENDKWQHKSFQRKDSKQEKNKR
ncbi:hypothetical protein [Aliikangiella sp. IMCC44359]|uniref:hypothetical protein n=1 Tax=Aliikangiella sp. IMCC44359 TaxID=3459125 RepID=UPI00403B2282